MPMARLISRCPHARAACVRRPICAVETNVSSAAILALILNGTTPAWIIPREVPGAPGFHFPRAIFRVPCNMAHMLDCVSFSRRLYSYTAGRGRHLAHPAYLPRPKDGIAGAPTL